MTDNTQSFRKLYSKLFQYRTGIIQICILHLIWTVVELIIPFLTQLLVDQGIQHQDLHFIYLLFLGQFMLFLGNVSSDFFKAWIIRHIGIRLNIDFVNQYIRKIMAQDILFLATRNEGVLIQNLNDNMRIEKFLTDSSQSLLNAIFKLTFLGIILLIFNELIGIIFVVSVVLLLLWDFAFLKTRANIDNEGFTLSSMIRSDLIEMLQGIIDIKVNSLEQFRYTRWEHLQAILSKVRLKILGLAQIYRGGTLLISQVKDILILFLAATSVINGQLTLGTMLAILYILGQMDKPILDIMQFVFDHQEAKLSFERVNQTTNQASKVDFPMPVTQVSPIREDLRIEDLEFSYNDYFRLKGVNQVIPFGSHTCIVGESGSGKSTIIRLLLKLLSPGQGAIYTGNRRLDQLPDPEWLSNCSVVSQDGFVFNGTLLYNITLSEDEQKTDYNLLYKAIEVSCLSDVVNQLAEGLRTKIGRNGQPLSKGQNQRVLIARAVYKNASYLIMDEPTNALDTITSLTVLKNILQFFRDRTIILTTHQLKIAEFMDNILLFDDGTIAETGTHETLMLRKGRYYNFYINK